MGYQLREINRQICEDTPGFLTQCDRAYQERVGQTAQAVLAHMEISPIVLLSGPSGSGKTTTALKLAEELKHRGVTAHAISLDNYFIHLSPKEAPRTPAGEIDYESPAYLDMELLDDTFTRLSAGEEVTVPRFDFVRQRRDPDRHSSLSLQEHEVAIFEGIHALGPGIAEPHPEALRLYVSPQSELLEGKQVRFTGPHLRLLRRAVRDYHFRGTSVGETLDRWDSVCRGEDLYIAPYRDSAHIQLDSALPYEAAVMKSCALPLLEPLPESETLAQLKAAFDGIETVDPKFVDTRSLLREFMGGSRYQYQ